MAKSRYDRTAVLLRRYGITLLDKNAILKAQGGHCYICRRKAKTFCIDHCHVTGFVRGVLCWKCNQGLSFFGDNVPALQRATEYLNRAWDAWGSLKAHEHALWWPYRGRINGKIRAKRISKVVQRPRLPLEHLIDVTA